MVELITKIGPDIPEIARRIGRHKETVRYWYKEKILDKGFAVQSAPNHEKIGLTRVVLVTEFASEYEPYASSILTAMSEIAYLQSFAKTLLERVYVINASVPHDLVASWIDFVRGLEQKGLFRLYHVVTLDLFRNPPMQAKLYDFDTGFWNFDWSTTRRADPRSFQQSAETMEKFDRIDLALLQEFQYDANKSMTEIAEKLKINYKTLAWHFKTHVIGRALLKNYRVMWTGTRYDYKLEKALNRKHRYMWVYLLVSDISEKERMEIMARTNAIPFIWSESSGKNNYFGEFALPIDSLTEALQFLQEILVNVQNKNKLFLIDQTKAMSFSIAPSLYDEGQKKWTFNGPELMQKFENLLLKIKSETG